MLLVDIILFLLGACFGSFLNVLSVWNIQNSETLLRRSHCDHCSHVLCWYELIPVFSWIFQGGKSRCCHATVSLQYPLIEFVTAIGFVLIPHVYPAPIGMLLPVYIIFFAMVGLFVVDMRYEILPTPLLIIGFMGSLMVLFQRALSVQDIAISYLLPTALAFLFFFALWRFTKGRAMGDGDMYLVLIIGLCVGYPFLIIAFYVAFLTGAGVGVILMIGKKKSFKSHIAFGPFLIFGFLVASLYGKQLMTFWSGLW